MRRYVRLGCNFWSDTAGWPAPARTLYLYLWSNTHVHGTSGIGRIPDSIIRAETGLSARQLGKAWEFLTDGAHKVVQCDGWYWVVERIKHVCFQRTGEPSRKHVAAVCNLLRSGDLPQELAQAVMQHYDTLSMGYPRLMPDSDSDSDSETPLPPAALPQDSDGALPPQRKAGGGVEKMNGTTATVFVEEWRRQFRGDPGISDEQLSGFVRRFPGSRVAYRKALSYFRTHWKRQNPMRWLAPFADFERWLAEYGGSFKRFEPDDTSSDGEGEHE